MTRYYSMRDVSTVRYAIGIALRGAGAHRFERHDPRHRHARRSFRSCRRPIRRPASWRRRSCRRSLGSLFLIAMVSAIMSTVNSILLVTGGAFAHDLYKRLVNPHASERRLIWINRISIVVLGRDPVLVRVAEARRRAGHRRRAGQVHRELLLRAGRGRTELAPRDEGRGDLEHGGGLRGLPRVDVHACSAASRRTASTPWKWASR